MTGAGMKPYRLFTAALLAAATVPRLAHRGMFVDGLTYAAIARNLAKGQGRFWSPFYTSTVYPHFHEHPPLGLWLESLWFRVLGDHLFVERAYSLTAAIVIAALIALIYRRVEDEAETRDLEWLPVVFWLAVPVVSWTLVGNLLDTTVAVFTTASVYAVVRSLEELSITGSAMWGVVAGSAVAAAVLTKGPTGLVPLVAPPLLFLFAPAQARVKRHPAVALAVPWMVVAGCAAVVAVWPAARLSVHEYLAGQLWPSLAGRREVSAGSFAIVGILFRGVLLPEGLVTLGFGLASWRWVWPDETRLRRSLGFFLLALAATLPIVLSAKQAGHYLMPAIPFYAIAAATLLAPTVDVMAGRIGASRTQGFVYGGAVLVIGGTLIASVLPVVERDRHRLADLDALASAMPRGAIVSICPELNGDWGLHAWCARLFEVSLDASAERRELFLRSGASPDCTGNACTPITDPSRRLVLMRCK